MSNTLQRKWWLAIISMVLMLAAMPLLTACGGGGDDGDEPATLTSASTSAASLSSPATTTKSDKPVKIGVISAWTGPEAMTGLFFVDPIIKVVEKQLEDMGGILGGRPVKFVRFDTASQTAQAAAGARKLLTVDKVSAITIGGGGSNAEAQAVSDVTEAEKVFFASVNTLPDVAEKKYTVVGSLPDSSTINDTVRLILEVMTPRPQTVGVMTFNDPGALSWGAETTRRLKDAGIKIVYEQYLTHDVQDFSPYLTRIKYEHPDCLVTSLDNSQYLTIAKQIMELGGWGGTQMVTFSPGLTAAKKTGAEGWIVQSAWHPLKDDPESLKFKKDFEAVNGKSPDPNHVYIYNTIWMAVHAIEFAGTDDQLTIAQAARSGALEFDTPMGRAHIGTDGENGLGNMFVQIQKDGSTVPFPQ